MRKKLLILLAALMAAVNAYTADFEVDGIYYNIISTTDKTVEVTKNRSDYSGNVVIPSTVSYNGTTYSVTAIGYRAFYECYGLTSVSIPNSVITIDNYAFAYSTGVTSVNIPNSVTSIGDRAFQLCARLTSVNIPSSVTSIGEEVFSGSGLTSVTIPSSVISIGRMAFYSCSGLTSVTIPNSVVSIDDSAFGFSGLTSVTIPNSVTTFGRNPFADCESLSTFYGKYASEDNRCLISDTGKLISFAPQGLTSYTVPNTVISIGECAFDYGSGPTKVTIPNSVISIGKRAFSGCRCLAEVSIPNSVTSIGEHAFYDCDGLTSVIIPNSVTSIDGYAFDNCGGLTSVTIGNSVASIGKNAFSGCSGLTEVSIPNSVTSIGGWAFQYCRNLMSVTIPNSVTYMGDYTFSGCSSLTSVTILGSKISIGEKAFYDTSIYNDESNWENGLLYIGNHLIEAKSDQISGDYAIKEGTLTIAGRTFSKFSTLTSVIFPNSVTTIGDRAFFDCSGLTTVTIPSSVTTIGNSAFDSCNNLTSVTVKNSDPTNISVSFSAFSDESGKTLYVPRGTRELYANTIPWRWFGTINEFSSTYELVDGEPYSEGVDLQGVDVTYTRNFTAAIWQPLYVPYNMSYDEWKDYGRVAELSCVHAYEDGRTTIEFVSVTGGELLPNVPYVFLPNATGEVTFTGTDKTLKAAPAENTKYIMCSSPRYTFKIYGNYQTVSGGTLATYGDSQYNGAYVMTRDSKFQHCSTASELKPFRFYITREKSANGYWGAPARYNAPAAEDDNDVIYFMVDGQICGIADVVTDADGNGVIYDLMGREVKNPINGIYIQNGKKIQIAN